MAEVDFDEYRHASGYNECKAIYLSFRIVFRRRVINSAFPSFFIQYAIT